MEPISIETLVGCLVPALLARCCMDRTVVKGVHNNAHLPFVLLCELPLFVLIFMIDMSNTSRSGASPACPKDPQSPHEQPGPEFEGEVIDANAPNVELLEPGDVQSRLQRALAALCSRHKPSHTVEPRMLRLFLDQVVPQHCAIQRKDTLPAMLMHKIFSIPVLTVLELVGKITHNKHETSYGVKYLTLFFTYPLMFLG